MLSMNSAFIKLRCDAHAQGAEQCSGAAPLSNHLYEGCPDLFLPLILLLGCLVPGRYLVFLIRVQVLLHVSEPHLASQQRTHTPFMHLILEIALFCSEFVANSDHKYLQKQK
jgi:hypothetical protein